MRIVLMPSAFYPAIGGVEELSNQLALAYARKGHDVIVVTNRWPRDLPPNETSNGVQIHRLPFRMPHRSLKGRISYPLTSGVVSRSFHQLVRAHRADVIHVQCVSCNAFYALRAQRRLGVPVVVTTQGELTMDAAHAFEQDPAMIALMRRALHDAAAVTACSSKTLADVEAFVGHPIDGARVIYNGTTTAAFPAARESERPYVLAIGRLAFQKGFDLLIQAWSRLRPDHVRLVIAGEGPERQRLEALVDELDLRDTVELPGAASRTEVPALYAGSHAVVVPSRADEGFPLVVAETLAAGRPLVATRSGGVAELAYHEHEALLVDREDLDGLTAALARVLDDERLRHDLGVAARARSASLDWDALADQYLEVLTSVAKRRP